MCVQLLLVLLLLTCSNTSGQSDPKSLEGWASLNNSTNLPAATVQNALDGKVARFDDPEYEKALTTAFCKAKCMVGESIPHLDLNSLFLTNSSTCESQRCLECEKCLKVEGASEICGSEYQLPSFCMGLLSTSQSSYSPSVADSSPMNHTTTARDEFLFSDFMSPRPLFHCSQKHSDNVTFNAAFRFEYENQGADATTTVNTTSVFAKHHPQVLSNFTSWTPDVVPRVFVIRQELAGRVNYVVYEKWTYAVEIPERTRLSLSVTAISASTIYKQSPLTTIQLQDSPHRAGGKPRNLRVVYTRLVNVSSASANVTAKSVPSDPDHDNPPPVDDILNQMNLEVVVHWESGSGLDATCSYGLWCLHDFDRKVESKTPERVFWAVLGKEQMGSKFGAKLKIDVVEQQELGPEVNPSTIIYVLPKCLDFLNGDFSKCAPPPVQNLRGHLKSNGFLTLDWNPPVYNPVPDANGTTSKHLVRHKHDTHHVKNYTIDIQRLSPGHFFPSWRFPVPGNTTHFEQLLTLTSQAIPLGGAGGTADIPESLLITVRATTGGGTSEPSTMTVQAVQSSSFLEKLLTTIGLIFGLILLVAGAFFVKNFFQKHQRKKSNREYFETLSLNGGEIPQVDTLRHAEMAATLVQETFLHGYELTKWEISEKNVLLKEEIGRGAFGIVRRGLLYEHGKERSVAVKIPKNVSGVSGETETKKFWEEFEILKSLGKHVHIVGLIGVLASKPYQPPSLVVEYCQGGDLKSHLTKHCRYSPLNKDTTLAEPDPDDADEPDSGTNEVEKKTGASSLILVTNEIYGLEAEDEEQKKIYDLTDLDLISYARQVACGMEFLATNKVVHRDLAARNVLVSIERTNDLERGFPKRTLKISDFGLSRDIYEQNLYKRSSEGLIPIKWLALECLLQGVYTSKSDVWSFGILLWEIVTLGGNPYPGVENTNIYQMLREGYRMPKPSNCPDSLYEMMESCWEVNPSRRPDFTQLKADLDKKMESSADLNYLNLDSTGIHEPTETKTNS